MHPEQNLTFSVSLLFVWNQPHEKLVFTINLMHFSSCFAMSLTARSYSIVLEFYLFTERLYNSELNYTLLAGPSCTCGLVGGDTSMLFYYFHFERRLVHDLEF